LICVLAIIFARLVVIGVYNKTGLSMFEDIGQYWAAAHLVLQGHPAGPYVEALQSQSELQVYRSAIYQPFLHPPIFLLLLLPFGMLPFLWAVAAFTLVTGAAYLAAIYQATDSIWMVIAAFAFPAVLLNFVDGQDAMLTAAIIGGGLTLMDRHPRIAGLILGLMIIKPHLALAVPIALVLTRRWNVLGWAALSAYVLLLLSITVFGWGAWNAFLASTHVGRYVLEQGSVWAAGKIQSIFVVVRQSGGSVRTAYIVQLLSAGAALGVFVWALRRNVSPAVERSLIVLVSLIATPYLWPYDLVVLAFPLAWLKVEWTRDGFPPWGKFALVVVYLLPMTLFTPRRVPPHYCVFGLIGLVLYLVWDDWQSKRRLRTLTTTPL